MLYTIYILAFVTICFFSWHQYIMLIYVPGIERFHMHQGIIKSQYYLYASLSSSPVCQYV